MRPMMFTTPKHDTHTVRSLSTPSSTCHPVRRCGSVSSGNPTVRWLTCNHMHGLVGCCLRITLAGCLTKVCAQQARVVVSKFEKLEEEDEKRSEDKIRYLGHQRPTARLHRQVLVVL